MYVLCVIAAHVSVSLPFNYLRGLMLLCVRTIVVVRERRKDDKDQREEGR